MRLSEVAKSSISLAFSLGIVFAFGVAAWRYVILPYKTPPPRPVFVNDTKSLSPPKAIAKIATPAPPQPKAAPTNDPKVLYTGAVNADIGLVLRAEPTQGSSRIGGADYNADVSILKESDDREWVFIRQESTQEEGWVRAGNITLN